MNQKTWYRYDIAYHEPALVGFIAQIPDKWSRQERNQRVEAFIAALDFVHPVSDLVDSQEGRDE